MAPTPFACLADLGERLEKTSKRLELTAHVAGFLSSLEPVEIAPAVRMTVGQVFPEWDGRALNLSWQAVTAVLDRLTDATPELRDRLGSQAVDGGAYVGLLFEQARRAPAAAPPLTLLEVQTGLETLAGIAGSGSRARKEALLMALLDRASPREAKFLAKLIYQEMRHGVNEGIMLDAIAQAARVPASLVRRANQFLGDLGELGRLSLAEGEAGLKAVSVQLFRPVKPMLAQSAERMEEAFERLAGRLALEYKLDGARVQIHAQLGTTPPLVRIYSRNLGQVTGSLPDLVEEVRLKLAAHEAILDGEAIAADAQGRPLPFQHIMRRFRRKQDVAAAAEEIPVQLHLFDVLYADGRPLVDMPAQERWTALESAAGRLNRVRRLVPHTLAEAQAFAEDAGCAGHEGVMAKDLLSPYTPGVRGKAWLKLKHTVSLDLVIVAADWGYGRRHGWLSNYHLAARDEHSGLYQVVGKTFKGLTDQELEAMTARLLALEQERRQGMVRVRPEVVVEVLFNEIQESTQYPAGYALRFARISRIREDKSAHEADTLQTVRALYARQFEQKGHL
jgi:DNA ligase-1